MTPDDAGTLREAECCVYCEGWHDSASCTEQGTDPFLDADLDLWEADAAARSAAVRGDVESGVWTGGEPVDGAVIRCVVCSETLAVDPRNLSYKPADGHGPHDPVTGEWPRLPRDRRVAS